MKVSHDPETDMLYIEFEDRPSLESFELCDGIVVDLDADEHVVGIEIEDASQKVDIERLRAVLEPEPAVRPAWRADAARPPHPRPLPQGARGPEGRPA